MNTSLTYHTGVMVREVLELLRPLPGNKVLDGTVGGANHSREIAKKISPDGTLIALDKDEEAVEFAKEVLKDASCEVIIKKSDFVEMDSVCEKLKIKELDGILLDIGVSSYQLETPERGFSYQYRGPLDMRMDRSQEISAKEIVNKFSAKEMSRIFWEYGEERFAKQIAAKIEKERKNKEIETTEELTDIIKKAIPAKARRKGPHPAKRTFQALRIYVNKELENLEKALKKGVDLLIPGGRFLVISFHSLEDRIVKNRFKEFEKGCKCPPKIPKCICGENPKGKLVTKKPVLPTDEEIERNHRVRSARLRVFQKNNFHTSKE